MRMVLHVCRSYFDLRVEMEKLRAEHKRRARVNISKNVVTLSHEIHQFVEQDFYPAGTLGISWDEVIFPVHDAAPQSVKHG